MSDYTSLLYAMPSAFDSIAGLFDFGDTLTEYNTADTAELADFNAIGSDWRAVGQDMEQAAAHYAQERDK